MRLFVARHGQTTWNAQNKICSITDVDLTEKGIEQAHLLALSVKEQDIDIIISSPLNRAVATSRIVSDECNIPMKIDERLIEQDYGIFEGADGKDEDFLNHKRNFAYKYPNGESMMQVAYRVYGLLEEIKKDYCDKNILIVSHGGVCRIINTYFRDMTNEEFFNYRLENGKLEEYVI